MIIGADKAVKLLRDEASSNDPLIITPQPDLEELEKSGAAAIDLRLGTWFLKLRESRIGWLKMNEPPELAAESRFGELKYIPLGDDYILHPRSFVLAVSFEWIRLPANLAGYVTGRSSWGRRGLTIATATGVHPGFTGCLTLELSNVGELPMQLMPGAAIYQLFLHEVKTDTGSNDRSTFLGHRRPVLGPITLDKIAQRLRP